MKKLSGKAGSYGIALGTSYIVKNQSKLKKKITDNHEAEIERFLTSVKKVKALLLDSKVAKVADDIPERSNCDAQAHEINDIIDIQIELLTDKAFHDKVFELIKNESVSAEYATQTAAAKIADELSSLNNEYLSQRSADVNGISQMLINDLTGDAFSPMNELSYDSSSKEKSNSKKIVVVDELTPELITTIDKELICGFVSGKGAYTTHASILCGSLEIPYLFGVDLSQITNNTEIAINCDEETLFINPTEEIKESLLQIQAGSQEIEGSMVNSNASTISHTDANPSLPIKLMANISSPDEATEKLFNMADGIGLFRTEFLYMGDKLPTEQEQFDAYKKIAKVMKDKETIIRTMDIGADKTTSCLDFPTEANPALGKRAIRFCLENASLFRTQLRAIMRAACHGNISVMFPMITSLKELHEIKEQINLAAAKLDEQNIQYKIPPIGIMIETPSAAILSDIFAKEVDFFSIGTNDLTQYTLALDRMNEGLERFYDSCSTAVLRLIELVVTNAHKNGIRVGICGELAGDPKIIPKLYSLGIDELSMSLGRIPQAKKELAKCAFGASPKDSDTCHTLALLAPADGALIQMKDIPDEAFSSGSLGECIAIKPDNENVYAPCDGTITMIAQTGHALCLQADTGEEILIHVGINTVSLEKKVFSVLIKENNRVKKGDRLMTVDFESIKKANLSELVIMVVLSNP